MIVKVASTGAQVVLGFTKEGSFAITPGEGFDFDDQRNIHGLEHIIQAVHRGQLQVPPHIKAAIVAVPGGASQQATPQQSPQLATTDQVQELAQQVQQLQQVIQQLTQPQQPAAAPQAAPAAGAPPQPPAQAALAQAPAQGQPQLSAPLAQ
jgi:outer membrane murein-binding lipoprotein Lpp